MTGATDSSAAVTRLNARIAATGGNVIVDLGGGVIQTMVGIVVNSLTYVTVRNGKILVGGTSYLNQTTALTELNSADVLFENMEVDYVNPPFVQGVCTATTGTTANFDVSGYWAPTFGDIYRIEAVDTYTHEVTSVVTFGPGTGPGYPIALVSGTVWQVSGLSGAIAGAIVSGTSYILTNRPYGSAAFDLDGGSDIEIRKSKVRAAGGMCLFSRFIDRLTVDGLDLSVPPGSNRWRSSNADGVHGEHISGRMVVVNSTLERGGDDACASANYPLLPSNIASPSFTLTVTDIREVVNTGDIIAFTDNNGFPQGTGTVLSSTGNGTTTINVTMTAALPAGMATNWLVNLQKYSAPLFFANNQKVGHNRGRGVCCAGLRTKILNSVFSNTFSAAVYVGQLYYSGFGEGTFSMQDVTVDGCVFESCQNSNLLDPAVVTIAALTPAGAIAAIGAGVDAAVTYCKFEGCTNSAVFIGGFTGATISGNTVDGVAASPNTEIFSGLTAYAIAMQACGVVSINGNRCVSGVSTIGLSSIASGTPAIGSNPNMSLASGIGVVEQLFCSNNSGAAGSAAFIAATGGANGGDPRIQFIINGIGGTYVGINNSDNDRLKFSRNSSFSDAFGIMETAGQAYFALRGYIAGVLISNDVGTPTTKIDVSAGCATDSTGIRPLIGIAGVIDCTTVGANGLDAGSLAASTWYAVHIIGKTDNTTAYLASTSYASPVLPSGYVYWRCVGWVKTDASSHIRLIFCEPDGATVYWGDTTNEDVNTNATTTASLQTLVSVPPGIKVRPIIRASSATTAATLSSPDQPDLAPSTIFATSPGFMLLNNSIVVSTPLYLFTNTSQQLRMRGYGTTAVVIYVDGWIWDRGEHA